MSNRPANAIPLSFLHPRSGKHFEVDAAPEITGADAIASLVDNGFIEAASEGFTYGLQHTRLNKTLPLTATLAEQGVKANDVIAVLQLNAGA